MKVKEIEQGILLEEVQDFDAKHIFECGQCFRWKKELDGSYTGVAYGKAINVKSDYDKEIVLLRNTNLKDFEGIWQHYFDLGRDYSIIKQELSKDEVLKEAIKYGRGIRILNQEPWEVLLSFIISANNNIPRISRSIDLLSQGFGKSIIYQDKVYFSFPQAVILGKAEPMQMEQFGLGYRSSYVYQSAQRIANGEFCLEAAAALDTAAAKKELMKLPGVGPKVSDCILLFSMQKHDAYPIDVWVKRVTEHFYMHKEVSVKQIQEFARNQFGSLAGFAQQYLFYYAREQKIK